MLEEIGLPYNHRICKPWSRVAKSVHPMGKVPALSVENKSDGDNKEEDSFVVLESAAINTFLGDLAREITNNNQLLVPPPATPQRAKYDSLVLFVMTEIDSQSLWIHRKHEDLANVFGEAPTAVQEAKRQFENALDVVAAEIAPTGFSAVDILFVHCCVWAQQIGWLERTVSAAKEQTDSSDSGDANAPVEPKHLSPKLAAYLKRCRSRPAFIRTIELKKNQVHEENKKEPPSTKL